MPATPPLKAKLKPARSEGSEALRMCAHTRLDQLFDQAEDGRLYGIIGVEITFESGQPRLVRRKIDGTDKAAP